MGEKVERKVIGKFLEKKFPNSGIKSLVKMSGGLSESVVFKLRIVNPKKELLVKIFPQSNIGRVSEEKRILDYLSKKDFRIQKVVFFKGEFCENLGILVTTFIEGKTLHFYLKNKCKKYLREVAFELAKIHKLSNTRSWTSKTYPMFTANDWLKEIDRKIRKVENKRYKKYLHGWFDKLRKGKLRIVPLHGDFNPKNIIVSKNGVGLIDFEIHRIGDLPFELACIKNWFLFYGYLRYFEDFLDEYTKIKGLSDEEIKRIDFYYFFRLITTMKYAPKKNKREIERIIYDKFHGTGQC